SGNVEPLRMVYSLSAMVRRLFPNDVRPDNAAHQRLGTSVDIRQRSPCEWRALLSECAACLALHSAYANSDYLGYFPIPRHSCPALEPWIRDESSADDQRIDCLL